ncbi:MAG: FadR/GntR family transcriptional regulator [Bacillota bacterium]
MAQFSAIRTKRIYVEIVDQIKKLIDQGELRFGDRLPPERELAAKFGVGRPAVREALSALEMKGLIEIQPGQGAYIKGPSKQVDMARLEIDLGDQVSPMDLLEARRIVETHVVELAAARATQEDIERLAREANDARERYENSGEFSMEADREFHIAIGEATQNPVLAGVSRFLCGMMSQTLWRAMTEKNLLVTKRGSRYVAEHCRIARAIQARDGHAARHEMFAHLSGVIEDLYDDSNTSTGRDDG